MHSGWTGQVHPVALMQTPAYQDLKTDQSTKLSSMTFIWHVSLNLKVNKHMTRSVEEHIVAAQQQQNWKVNKKLVLCHILMNINMCSSYLSFLQKHTVSKTLANSCFSDKLSSYRSTWSFIWNRVSGHLMNVTEKWPETTLWGQWQWSKTVKLMPDSQTKSWNLTDLIILCCSILIRNTFHTLSTLVLWYKYRLQLL